MVIVGANHRRGPRRRWQSASSSSSSWVVVLVAGPGAQTFEVPPLCYTISLRPAAFRRPLHHWISLRPPRSLALRNCSPPPAGLVQNGSSFGRFPAAFYPASPPRTAPPPRERSSLIFTLYGCANRCIAVSRSDGHAPATEVGPHGQGSQSLGPRATAVAAASAFTITIIAAPLFQTAKLRTAAFVSTSSPVGFDVLRSQSSVLALRNSEQRIAARA